MIEETGSLIQTTTAPTAIVARRFYVLPLLLAVVTIGLLSRSFYLQVLQGTSYRAAAEGNRVSVLPLPAPRGIVYDANGTQLTENIASTDLVLDPVTLPRQEHEAFLIDQLPQLVPDLSADAVRSAIHQVRATQRVVPLSKALDHDTVLRIEANQDSLAGARLTSSLVRRYLYPDATAHVVGYTGPVTPEELSTLPNVLATEAVGKTGLERSYDQSLRGNHGASYTEVNASGRPQQDLGADQPVPGTDLRLSLDTELQQFIMSLFSEKNQERQEREGKPVHGAAVALDPRTGEIKALVSFPSFDPNSFSQPSRRREETAALFTDQAKPLFNRAVDGTYPPGSVIKPFLAAAALDAGVITPQTTILSTGGISVGPWQFPDWKSGGHGVTDVRKAIAESVNTFFYTIIGGFEDQTGLGLAKTTAYLRSFGWGTPTAIDLASEASGFLPSEEWKEQVKNEPWYIGDTYHLSIGQGDVLVTPLQVAQATAALADGKILRTPHISSAGDARETPLDISAAAIAEARAGMRQTVTDGSGIRLRDLPIALAGKTGTAQVGGRDDTHAWFTSFGPYEDAQLTITVLLEFSGEGDKVAVPFTQEIWQWWIEHRYDQP